MAVMSSSTVAPLAPTRIYCSIVFADRADPLGKQLLLLEAVDRAFRTVSQARLEHQTAYVGASVIQCYYAAIDRRELSILTNKAES